MVFPSPSEFLCDSGAVYNTTVCNINIGNIVFFRHYPTSITRSLASIIAGWVLSIPIESLRASTVVNGRPLIPSLNLTFALQRRVATSDGFVPPNSVCR